MGFNRYTPIIKTRIERLCSGCLELIPKGSSAIDMAGTFEGQLYHGTLCSECDHYLMIHLGDFVDGWSEGDIGTARKENIERG